jgi:hypothetical protein
VAVHQPSPDSTQAIWLDSTPDLSCIGSIQAYWVDGEHQPTDLAVGGTEPAVDEHQRRSGSVFLDVELGSVEVQDPAG